MPLTACIVPLCTGLSKSFLCYLRLRNWGTVNKNKLEVLQNISFDVFCNASNSIQMTALADCF